MPLIGMVDAYGLTTGELERRIEQRLRGGYLREPRVSVEVEAYRPFFILGEVTNAGQYPYINGMTVRTPSPSPADSVPGRRGTGST